MNTKIFKLLLPLLASSLFIQAQRGMQIAYIDMEYILENVSEYQEANTQLSNKVQKWKTDIEQREGVIQQMKKDLSVEKVLLTKELIEEREEEITFLEEELFQYQQDRFGPKGDLEQQQNLLVKPVQDQVFTAVQEIAKNKRYDMVLDRSDAVMLFALEKYDISDLILRSINRSEKKAARAKKARKGRVRFGETLDDNTPTENNDAPDEIDTEAEIQRAAVEEQRAERQKQLEENRRKKNEEREAKKKAFEERRQKILAEREARLKAKQEARKKAKEEKENKEPDTKQNN